MLLFCWHVTSNDSENNKYFAMKVHRTHRAKLWEHYVFPCLDVCPGSFWNNRENVFPPLCVLTLDQQSPPKTLVTVCVITSLPTLLWLQPQLYSISPKTVLFPSHQNVYLFITVINDIWRDLVNNPLKCKSWYWRIQLPKQVIVGFDSARSVWMVIQLLGPVIIHRVCVCSLLWIVCVPLLLLHRNDPSV